MKRRYKESHLFKKKLSKLNRQNLRNVLNKVEDILTIKDLNLYKNLRYDLKKFKRVHINNSYVILFFGDDNIVYFVDYVSHDEVYNYDKKTMDKYKYLKF